MIFESMWPLFFLAAIPVIIILYLLKPKGKDYRISSNLLWQQLLRNQESKTFLEKFVHNILMYLQILIILLLVIAFMSPFLRVDGQGGRVTLLIDTSASMQHVGSSGLTRLEEAVEEAGNYVQNSGETRFSIVTHDDCGTNLLAVDMTDKSAVMKALRSITASDSGGTLSEAQSLLATLSEGGEGEGSRLLIFTDGCDGTQSSQFTGFTETTLFVVGETAQNVSNDYLAFGGKGDMVDVIMSVTNHGDSPVSLDVSLYEDSLYEDSLYEGTDNGGRAGEDEGRLLSVKQMTLGAGENAFCLFEQVDWQGSSLKGVLSGFSFEDGSRDSLETDNVSYAVRGQGSQINALFAGAGNTYIEKAYRAAVGSDITKAENDSAALTEEFGLVIYDIDTTPSADYKGSRLLIRPQTGRTDKVANVMLNMRECDLTEGLSDFFIGVNEAYCYELPEGAESFLEYEGKCIGYYGDYNGYREVVLGFDIRESNFPLQAEFPVFMANVLTYLSDSSWLGKNVYYAGETLLLKPWAGIDRSTVDTDLKRAGLYTVGDENYQESYVVRPATVTESDGHVTAESDVLSEQISRQKTRRALRNLFLILALVLLCVEWILYVKQLRYRGKFYLFVRLAVFACLILALAGIRLHFGSSRNVTVFVVDMSDSNAAHLDGISAYLQERISDMPRDSQYGIVTFGSNTLVEQFLTKERFYAGLMTTPEQTATNLEEAISRALTMIPSDAGGRLVLLTDGRQTRGDVRNMASAVTAGKAQLLAIVFEAESQPDTYVEDVELPAYLHPGDIYSVTVQVESNYDTDAQINLLSGSSVVSSSEVHLNRGSNRFVFKQQVGDESMESLRVQVSAPGDSCAENNTYSAYSVVEAPPKVLVIAGKNTDTSQFTAMLSAAGCDYSLVSTVNAPQNINQMLDYESIFLVNSYIGDLPDGFLEHIESYVRDYGGGFVCCGGEDSFALGGYRNSALETVLPVDMEMRNQNEIPSMAMVMVIDRSGSMLSNFSGDNSATNLDLAIQATTVAVDNLRDSDYVGVLTFDDLYSWQVELTLAEDRSGIKKSVEGIDSGGGTTIKPALQEAYRVISQCDASIKHVILLTDGMGETTDFRDIIRSYEDGGVTLSTVAVGEGSDTSLLETLARACGGRYYYSDMATDIPKIFAQEVFLGGDSYIQNGDFALSVYGNHDLTRGLFTEGWPNLYGYVSATPKAGSQMLVASAEKEDPILTVWQYGLGRTVAWNSDVTNQWSGAYAGQTDYIQLWKRIVDYSAGNAELGEDSVNVVNAGEVTELVYTTPNYDSQTEVTAHYVEPDGQTGEVTLHATTPGRYETELDTPKAGIYNLHIRRSDNGEVTSTFNTAAAVQFSDEYKFDVNNAAFLDFIDKYGESISVEDKLWNRRTEAVKGSYPLTNWLLALGILLFLADVAMRRFQYVPRWKPGRKAALPLQNGSGQSEEGGFGVQEDVSGAGGSAGQTGVSGDGDVHSAENGGKGESGKERKRRSGRRGQAQAQEQALDTSQLLRKKDERNLF